jgi:hypothetical protein
MRERSKQVVLRFNAYAREHIPTEKLQVFFEVMEKLNEVCDDPQLFEETSE